MLPEYHTVQGLRMAIYEAGDPTGPPVFFLHGNSGAAALFTHQFQDPDLQCFRLVAIDLPGHGHSAAAPGRYGIGAMQAVVLAALHMLELRRCTAIGHSYGGHLLLELLPDLPELRGLLTVGTPPVSSLADMQVAFPADATRELYFAENLTTAQAHALAAFSLRPAALPEERALLVGAIVRTDGRARAELLASALAGEMGDEVGYVARSRVPLALTAGEFDQTMRFAYFANLTAPSRWLRPLHLIAAAGHAPFLENPKVFNRLLADFLSSTTETSGQQ